MTWWFFTHRLDRFWLPLLPALAVLAGLGADWTRKETWSVILKTVMGFGLAANFIYITTALAGLNEWTADLNHLRRDLPVRWNAAMARMDAELPPDAKPLLVGQAAVFHLQHNVAYNTVFNPETIEQLGKGKTPEQFRRGLKERNLTHIYVDWKEIGRHRGPGGYGFSEFVVPARFSEWVAAGVLAPARMMGPEQELYEVSQVVRFGQLAMRLGIKRRSPSTGGTDFMDGLAVVTGGAGFIGSHLVNELVDRAMPVRVVERPGAAVEHLPRQAEVLFADIRDRAALDRAFERAEWVYHLAANPNLWARNRDEFDAVNHRGTVNVLDAALEAGAERVLHTSTESILTKAELSGPIDENIEIRLSDAVGPYCRSKLLAEQYAFSLAGKGLPVVVANPTMPVGPGDRNLSPPTRLVLDFCRGESARNHEMYSQFD